MTDNVTQLLLRWSDGDRDALDALMPIVERELRQMAARHLRRERPGHTLQPTALVNEAYVKLIEQHRARWQNRAQFFAVAARMMRRILVDHARAHVAAKRGGPQVQVSLSEANRFGARPEVDLVAVHDALEALAALDEQQAHIVEMKFFGGMTIEEIAEALGVGHATVERDWKVARAWLRNKLD